MLGLIPLITFQEIFPIENSTSTQQSFSLVVLSSCGLLILRNALPKSENVRASRIVDLPAPLVPTIIVLPFSFNLTSV